MSSALPWSYSRISCFKDCKRKYRFRYLDRIKSVPGPAAARGNRIHRLLEQYVQLDTEGRALERGLAADKVSLRGAPADYVEALRAQSLSRPGTVMSELALTVSTDWHIVKKYSPEHWGTAIFDVFQETGGGNNYVVYDYKTGKVYPEAHEFQAAVYALTAYKVTGKIPAVNFLYLDQGEHRTYPDKGYFTGEDLADAEFLLGHILAEMAAEGAFPKQRTGLCRFCDYRDLCQEED